MKKGLKIMLIIVAALLVLLLAAGMILPGLIILVHSCIL